MSSVTFLEKLLNGVEAEWRPLGDLVKTVTAPSKLNSQSYCATGKLPIIDQGIEFIAGYTDEEIVPVRAGRYVIFGDHSEHIKYVDFSFVQGADGIKILQPIAANAKYIYYALQKFYKKELNYKRHWSSAQKTLIPIPSPENPKKSLEIQAEIVRILDTFTKHTAELTAELTARKKQYIYYRDQLLSFEDGEVEWKTLGETCDVHTGGEAPESGSMSRTPTDIYKYPIYGNGVEVYGYTDSYKINKDAVTISSIGANTGTVYFRKAYFTPIIRLKVLMPLHERILPRYLFHILSSITIGSKSSSVPNMNAADVKRISIPVPSIENQVRIATILDKFDTVTSSLTEGLPLEIALRQKQYEYYRDLLLSFPKAEGAET